GALLPKEQLAEMETMVPVSSTGRGRCRRRRGPWRRRTPGPRPLRGFTARFQLDHATPDTALGYPGRLGDRRDPAVPELASLRLIQQPPLTLVQKWHDCFQLPPQRPDQLIETPQSTSTISRPGRNHQIVDGPLTGSSGPWLRGIGSDTEDRTDPGVADPNPISPVSEQLFRASVTSEGWT
ncbi:MAG: hypothetical protein QOI83_4389, partial [Streptomycetaceae bacterium]|nr:hypothetical protein [Streptomycetaceae bacterium]